MSRWASLFHATCAPPPRDTVDTVDTEGLSGVSPPHSVNSVNSVMPGVGADGGLASSQEAPSPAHHCVHSVNSVTGDKDAGTAVGDTGSIPQDRSADKRPASWSDPDEHPQPGWWCGCCHGHRWWIELDAPQGWRCATCHPPAHLPAAAVRGVVTSTTEEEQAA